jgi:hypothetical protein
LVEEFEIFMARESSHFSLRALGVFIVCLLIWADCKSLRQTDEIEYVRRNKDHFLEFSEWNIVFHEDYLSSFVAIPSSRKLTASLQYQIGQNIEGNWKDLGTYYKGRITAVHEDGTYAVKYAGGDFEDRIPESRLKALESEIPKAVIPKVELSAYISNSTASHYGPVDFSPSADTPEGRLKQVYKRPAGLANQHSEDVNFIHFHRCLDSGEAYSASYLTSREHLLEHFTDYNLVR